MPAVSVVIPTFNHQAFVLQTLESVFAQTFGDYEVIVVNDGSVDETAKLLRPFADAGKIRYIEQTNRGQSDARNRGIESATGELIAFLDDDDLWEPDKLQWQVDALHARRDAVLVYGRMRTFGQGLRYTSPGDGVSGGTRLEDFVGRVWINSPGQTLIRADSLRKIGGFDPAIWGTDDWDAYLNLARIGPFVYEPKIALNYRYHGTNASKNVRKLWENATLVADKHFGPSGSGPNPAHWRESRRFIKKFISDDCFLHADYFAKQGDAARAMQLLKLAIRVRPIANAKRALHCAIRMRSPNRNEIAHRVHQL
jgi:glycosyltransferase involved in cell wall biosynthesis